MHKTCKICGCSLDPGEWCDCEEQDTPDVEQPRRPVAKKRTVYPREWNSQEYIERRWREWDLR